MAVKGEKLTFAKLGGEPPIPPKFVAAMARSEEVQALGENTTGPEALSDTIVESRVETDRTNERVRRTVKKTAGTISCNGTVRTEHGAGTLAETMIAANSATPDTSYLTLTDKIEDIGNGFDVREQVAVPSFPVCRGQEYNRELNAIIPYTEQRKAEGVDIGDAGKEITPEDFSRSMVRTYDLASLQAALDAFVQVRPGMANLPLPDVLLSITVTYNTNGGAGISNHPASQQGFGFGASSTSISGSYDPRSSAQGSASIMPSVALNIKQYWSQKVPTLNYFFYMADSTTLAAIIARLAALGAGTVNAWPNFKPEGHVLSLKGQQASVKAGADTQVSFQGSAQTFKVAYGYGNEESKEVGLSVREMNIPPMLHAALTIADATQVTEAFAEVNASTPSIALGAVTILNAIDNAPTRTEIEITAGVTPSSLSATSPAAIPTSGLYLVDLNTGSSLSGRTLYHAEVCDFSYFA